MNMDMDMEPSSSGPIGRGEILKRSFKCGFKSRLEYVKEEEEKEEEQQERCTYKWGKCSKFKGKKHQCHKMDRAHILKSKHRCTCGTIAEPKAQS